MSDVPPRPEPFLQRTDPAAIEDLRARLRGTRWPDAPEDAGWSLGTDLDYLRELVAYWADEFDWPAQEAALARLPRFRVGLGILPQLPLGGAPFIHARAAAAPAGSAMPLVPPTAGRTRSGATRRSSRSSPTPVPTAPTRSTSSYPTCRATDTPTAPAVRRSTPSPSPVCGPS